MFMNFVYLSLPLFLAVLMFSSLNSIFTRGNYVAAGGQFANALDFSPALMATFLQSANESKSGSRESVPDSGIDFDCFNESPHKGNIYNGIPYEYFGRTEQNLVEVFGILIGADFDDSNQEAKRQYVDTPQRAAQIVAILLEYEQKHDRFFYAVSLDEEHNCWTVEHRFYKTLRLDGGNISFFLVNRNDAKIIEIQYEWGAYFRDYGPETPEKEGIPGDPPSFLTVNPTNREIMVQYSN